MGKQINLEWSYIPTVEVRKGGANQLDWNYTIFAIINKAYSDYKKRVVKNKVEKTLIIPCKIMGLFYMLQYFDYENMKLMGRYDIEITHEDIDYIKCKNINTIIKVIDLYKKWDYIEE